ncbi:MAG: carbohydrate ABC transporter permease [Anaerolineae bacterium]
MVVTARRPSMGVQARKEERAFYTCIAPWLLGLLGFTLLPMIASFVLAMMRWNMMFPPLWVGSENYRTALKDPLFWQSLKVTVLYSIVAMPLDMVLGLFVAVLMNQKIPGMNIFRTIYYLPAVVSGVAVAILWQLIFNSEWGVLNGLLWQVFHVQGPRWLLDERWVLPAFVIISLWGVGGGMIIYLAGLQSVPTELYEAAELDGANQFERFRYVTLAWISPVIFFNLVMGIIASFQVFATSYVMTGGGPNNASLFYLLYLYQNAWQYFKMGYASALAWIAFAITMALTLLVIKSSPAWVYYESARGR